MFNPLNVLSSVLVHVNLLNCIIKHFSFTWYPFFFIIITLNGMVIHSNDLLHFFYLNEIEDFLNIILKNTSLTSQHKLITLKLSFLGKYF